MFKQKLSLEVKGKEKIYKLECDPDAPLGELHDAVVTMKSFIVQKMNDRMNEELRKDPEASEEETEVQEEEVEV